MNMRDFDEVNGMDETQYQTMYPNQLGNTKMSESTNFQDMTGPGPYYVPNNHGAVGDQLLSNMRSAPRIHFGTGSRQNLDFRMGPAPNQYTLPRESGTSYSLRSREKFGSISENVGNPNCGPGTYPRVDTKFVQKNVAPSYTMRSGRPTTVSRYPTPAPGHSQRLDPASTYQHSSKYRNVPSIAFGTSTRIDHFKSASGDVGPGEYGVGNDRALSTHPNPRKSTMSFRHPEPASSLNKAGLRPATPGIGPQVVSTRKTAPSFSMSGRVKFCGFRK